MTDHIASPPAARPPETPTEGTVKLSSYDVRLCIRAINARIGQLRGDAARADYSALREKIATGWTPALALQGAATTPREPDAWALMDGERIVATSNSEAYAELLAKDLETQGGDRYRLEPLYRAVPAITPEGSNG